MKNFFGPSISIVIPFFNAENSIEKCIESVVNSTKSSYEIVCVDDGSTDDSPNIIRNLQKKYLGIKLITFECNRGLYLARLEGIKKSRGRYLGFLDSDDYVSPHYYDNLLETAQIRSVDICVGQIINVSADGVYYLQSRCAIFPYHKDEGQVKSLYDMYWSQSGNCYHWHVVWNKIYKRKLFVKSLEVLERQTRHLVMTEDFIYSSIVLKKAKSYAVNIESKYYYIENQYSQTRNRSLDSIKKSLSDMKLAFEFVEHFLKSNGSKNNILYCFYKWKDLYHKIWKNNILDAGFSEEESEEILTNVWEPYPLVGRQNVDGYYYELAEIIESRD